MKFIFVFTWVIAITVQGLKAQKIVFKDQHLKRALLKEGFDLNKDGEIEVSEIDTVTVLDVSKKNIKSLDDLVWFKSLKSINANYNEITNLAVFYGDTVIRKIYFAHNRPGKKLILKNIKNLETLGAADNQLDELKLDSMGNIRDLVLMNNQFREIDLKNLLSLESVDLSGDKQLQSLDISANCRINSLYLIETGITRLDITHNPLLTTLYVDPGVQLIANSNQSNLKPAPTVTSNH